MRVFGERRALRGLARYARRAGGLLGTAPNARERGARRGVVALGPRLRSRGAPLGGTGAAASAPPSSVSEDFGTLGGPQDPSRGDRVRGVKRELEALLASALASAFPGSEWRDEVVIVPTTNPKFGDYQCNNAMPLFAKIKGSEGAPKNPRAVAEAIVEAIPTNDLLEEATIAGPGFINLKLSDAFVVAKVGTLFGARGGADRWAPEACCSRAVVDFSSPNVAKEMHVGHLRSTIIGDTLARCLEFTGVRVKRLNHVGDWGTQFGMLIQNMEEEGVAFDSPVGDLQQLYKDSKVRFDSDEDFKKRAQQAVVRLQAGSEESLARWEKICDASRQEFNKIYHRLGIEIEERGESHYNPLLRGLVAELRDEKVAEVSDGAVCIFVEDTKAPLIIQKSDGGFGYATTDLAALRQRLDEEHADWIIYVTDSGQSQHFKGVFAAARKCGWLGAPESQKAEYPKVNHVGFGLVLGEDGKRLRTRSGDVIKLVDLLDEAVARCKAQLLERDYDFADDEDKVNTIAQHMGYSAVKYADLKQNKESNYQFSFDRMLDLKGNTAVYLQYAHARVCSILAKAGSADPSVDEIRVTCEEERALLGAILQFPEAVESAIEDLAPNRLCEYLYNLTSKFTDFYSECQVVGSEEEKSRVLMCQAALVVIKKCFFILGMEPLDRI